MNVASLHKVIKKNRISHIPLSIHAEISGKHIAPAKPSTLQLHLKGCPFLGGGWVDTHQQKTKICHIEEKMTTSYIVKFK